MRVPEQPRWALMVNSDGDVVRVRELYAEEKMAMGWFMVARESELLPFNPPTLVIVDPNNEQDGA